MATELKTKVTTGKVLFCFPNVFVKTAIEGGVPKYNIKLVIPQKDKVTYAAFTAAIEQASLKGGQGGKAPKKFSSPIHDGDETDTDKYPENENSWIINAKSNTKPAIVDRDFNDILDPEEIYSGCFGRACINFYWYDAGVNKGVGAGLNSLMKLSDGEPLGGGHSDPKADFGDVEDDDLE
jgi:hypothetical protein